MGHRSKYLQRDYPLLLHLDSHITKIFLRDMHEDPAKLAHQDLKAILARSRHTYWIPSHQRPIIKINECVIRKLRDAHAARQIPADLLIQRMRIEDLFRSNRDRFRRSHNLKYYIIHRKVVISSKLI